MCPLNLYIIKDLSIMWIRVDLAEILAVHIPLDNLNIKDHNTLFAIYGDDPNLNDSDIILREIYDN